MSIAEQIKKARLAKGMTQAELARKMGVAQNTICGYEKGTREPNVLQINALADALDVSGDWLLESKWAYQELESHLCDCFRELNEDGKRALIFTAEAYTKMNVYKKESSEQKGIG